MAPVPPSPVVYQLRLVLTGISPMIWRRLLVSSETTIAELHEYIQICFDWDNEHLHYFRIQGKNYHVEDPKDPALSTLDKIIHYY